MALSPEECKELERITAELEAWYLRNLKPSKEGASPNEPPMLRTAYALVCLKDAQQGFGGCGK